MNRINSTNVLGQLKRLDVLIAVLLFTIVLVAGALLVVPGICGLDHDEGIYISTAKALASGHGYCLISLPGDPAQTKYPILYPSILAVIWWLFPGFPENLVLMKLASVMFGATAASLTYLYMVRWGYVNRAASGLGVLLCGLSPWFLLIIIRVLPEALFTVLWILALWRLQKQLRLQLSRPFDEFLTGLLLGLPFLCRVPGAAIIPVGLWLIYRAGLRIRWAALGASLMVFPWLLWTIQSWGSFLHDPIQGYYTDYLGWFLSSAQNPVGIWLFNFGAVMCLGATLILSSIHPETLSTKGELGIILLTLLGAIPWLVTVQLWRSHKLVLPLSLLSYLVVICICPAAPTRYLVPLLPILSCLLIFGLLQVSSKIRWGRLLNCLLIAVTAVVLISDLFDIAQGMHLHDKSKYAFWPGGGEPGVVWSDCQDLFAWLRQHSDANTIVATLSDNMLYLYTGCKAFQPLFFKDRFIYLGHAKSSIKAVDRLKEILERYRPTYVVCFPVGEWSYFTDLLKDLRTKYPQMLLRVYCGKDPRFTVFVYHPG